MAYTVGSASVEIVPDFRNAQLAITAFFRQQADEVRIPVKPQMDRDSVRNVERDAARAGSSVGKAISDGMSKSIDRTSIEALGKDITQLEGDIEKARNIEGRATAALQRAEDRLREARNAGNRSASQMLALEQAIEREQAKVADVQRTIITSTDKLREARRRLAIETQQAAAVAAGRSLAAQQRADEAAARAAIRSAERVAAERNRILQQEIRERARVEERYAREEERRLKAVYAQAARDAKQALKDADRARIQVEVDEKQAREAGRHTASIVTRSINHEIHQNAGLISGVLAGVFIAGAPAFIGAASTLFAGLGAVIAGQNDEIRQSWKGLWTEIKDAAQADGRVLIPTFDRLATSIGDSFQRMRPFIRDAFEAVGPQIDTFSRGLTNAAENALPGLVRAVQQGGPVIQGLASFLEDVGTGFSDFFDVLASHAPAAGSSFAELGETLQALLPTLAEILGQGAELASIVLPVLTTGLGGLNFVVRALGDSFPVLAAGFLAFRTARGAASFIAGLGDKMSDAAKAGGVFAGAQARVGSALQGVASVAGPVAVAAGLVGIAMAASEQQINDWAQALNEGGSAAERARIEMGHFDEAIKPLTSGFTGFIGSLVAGGGAFQLLKDDTDEAKKKNEEYLESLTPVESAQRDLDIATRALAEGLGNEGTSAGELAGLQEDVARASANATREQELLEMATQGVTEAMAAQADQARALVDAQFGYEKASRKAQSAQTDYNDAVKEFGRNSTEAKDALEVYNEALLKQVDAAQAVATSSLPASMDDQQKAILGAKGALDELNRLIASGISLPPEMEEYRQRLLQITGQADGAALAQAQLSAAIGQLGFDITALPGTKTIEIHAPTDELQKKLETLGFTIVELPNGDIRVEADTDKAMGNLGNLTTLLNEVDANTPEPKVSINDGAFMQSYKGLMRSLFTVDTQRPKPVASMDANPFLSTWGGVMGDVKTLGAQKPRPTVSLTDLASSGIIGIAGRLGGLPKSRTITITTVFNQIGSLPLLGGLKRAEGGAVGFDTRDLPRYDVGGATTGRGGPLEDLNTIRVSPGEHVLDARDVSLMGGQAGVYAFRELLNSGKLSGPGADSGARAMIGSGNGRAASAGTTTRDVTILTSDNPRAIIRAMREDEQQQAALAAPWG